MRTRNSLERVTTLQTLQHFFDDLCTHHPHLAEDLRKDFTFVTFRYEKEGVAFLTNSLPRLGKALTRSLEIETFSCPLGFKRKKGSSLPRMFYGLWNSVFLDSGRIRNDYDSSSLVDLFQLLFFFYKLELPYSKKLENKVIQSFVETERELSELIIKCDDPVIFDAQDLALEILHDFNHKDIIPKHGPGSVATGEKYEKKWKFTRKYKNIHRVYPYYEYFVPSRLSLLNRIRAYKDLENLESGCAKVTLVPKDSRGPRLISMEPLEYQFIQQALKRELYEHLESHCSITRGYVNFTDQNINRELAYSNSLSREYSTLDMKEASDRVSLQILELVFAKVPEFLQALKATRTTHTELPDGTKLLLKKFAPMGSALCFPVEALLFFILATVIKNRERIRGKVFVYGDDIIVPQKLTPHLFKLFPLYGLKFNEDKCFTYGGFRESCGMDAYNGVVCTPIRMKKLIPASKKQASAIVSSVSISNNLFLKGYWRTAEYIRSILPLSRIPVVPAKSNFGFVGYSSFSAKAVELLQGVRTRFEKSYQRREYRLWTPSIKTRTSKLDSYSRLFSNLVEQRIGRYSVPRAEQIKLRWMALY